MMRLLTIVFISMSFLSFGQTTKSFDPEKKKLDVVCDNFMKLFVQGKAEEALQLLKNNTVITPSSIDTLQATIRHQMTEYFPSYGKMISYEFITERKVKDFIAKRFYLLKFDRYYLKFDFTLYKTSTGWTVTNFKYSEDIVELLD